MNFKKIIATGTSITVAALSFAPAAFASTSVDISGNGRGSDNSVFVSSQNTNTLRQSNTSNFTNDVTTNVNTGDNSVHDNSGSNSSISTGNVNTDVQIENSGGVNLASLGNQCGCSNNDTNVSISDNLKRSDNSVAIWNKNSNSLSQSNYTNVNNDISTNVNTGNNRVSDNGGNNGNSVGSMKWLWMMQNNDWNADHFMNWWNQNQMMHSDSQMIHTGDVNTSVGILNGGSTNVLQ